VNAWVSCHSRLRVLGVGPSNCCRYRPRTTLLLAQAADHDCLVVEGIDVLLEQGLEQFERWTGRAPPRRRISAVVHDFYKRSPVSTDMSPLLDSRHDESQALARSLRDVDLQLIKILNARMALAASISKSLVRPSTCDLSRRSHGVAFVDSV